MFRNSDHVGRGIKCNLTAYQAAVFSNGNYIEPLLDFYLPGNLHFHGVRLFLGSMQHYRQVRVITGHKKVSPVVQSKTPQYWYYI